MAGKQVLSKTFMLFGYTVPCVKPNVVKVKVPRLVYDDYLHTYFREFEHYYACDPHKKSQLGDYIIIKELPERRTTLITHEVTEVVQPLGDVTDPMSGKKVVRMEYRDAQEEEAQAYAGGNPMRFKYDEAPPRGWQDGKRDFSNRIVPRRTHYDERSVLPPEKP